MFINEQILEASRKKLTKIIAKKNYKRMYVFADVSCSMIEDFDIIPTLNIFCEVAKQCRFESIYVKPFSYVLSDTITLYTAKANTDYIKKKFNNYCDGGTDITIVYDYIEKYIKNEDTLIIIISDFVVGHNDVNDNKVFLTADNIYYAYPNTSKFASDLMLNNIYNNLQFMIKVRPNILKKILIKKLFKKEGLLNVEGE